VSATVDRIVLVNARLRGYGARMSALAQPLPDDVEVLKTLILEERAAHAVQLERLREQVRLLLAQRFGAKSERLVAEAAQLGMFNEAEALAAAERAAGAVEADTVTIAEHRRARGHRRPLPEGLPRTVIIHDLGAEAKRCPHDGTALTVMGEDTSEQLDIVPAQVRVLVHRRLKYACPCCRQYVVTAPLPAQPVPRSQASPGLLATVAVAKYADALPLYRQSAQLQRLGVEFPRQTLASWMVRVGELIQPLVNLLRDWLLEGGYVQMDETAVQVLKEPGRAAQSGSFMWVQRSGGRERTVVLFDYDPSRAATVPQRLLAGFRGYLQTDGYAGYQAVVAANGLTAVYCLAHARRYFTDGLKALGVNPNRLPSAVPDKARRLVKALTFIRHLYAIEHRLRDATPEARYAARQAESVPVWAALQSWVQSVTPTVLPSSALGAALAYLHKHWDGLTRYCEDGRLEIDNNRCENAIRPFVTGRKNWLFSDTVRGAESSANLYSLIETAKANGLEPYAYLRRVFTELPAAQSVEAIEALLPWNCRPPPGG
jgi:transposase